MARRGTGAVTAGRCAHADGATGEQGLALDLAAVADVAGLAEEVALLRAAIRRLAQHGDAAEQVKVLAELRHQVEALCTALKTQQALDGHDGDARAAELARALDALGDELGGASMSAHGLHHRCAACGGPTGAAVSRPVPPGRCCQRS